MKLPKPCLGKEENPAKDIKAESMIEVVFFVAVDVVDVSATRVFGLMNENGE